MTIFSGLNSWLYCRENKIPMHFYWLWLREKWKADLKLIGWAMLMSPWLAVMATGAFVAIIGGAILAIKDYMPNCLLLSPDFREGQQNAVRAAKEHMEQPDLFTQ